MAKSPFFAEHVIRRSLPQFCHLTASSFFPFLLVLVPSKLIRRNLLNFGVRTCGLTRQLHFRRERRQFR